MNLKCLPLQERPRERLARYGIEALSTIELLAILLGSGTQKRSVLQLAQDLLTHFGSVQTLADASLQELQMVKGIGQAKAVQLKAAFGLLTRIEVEPLRLVIDSPQKVYDLIHSEMEGQKIETLMAILRDCRKGCLHREILSKGTLTELLLHPREIFHFAVRHRAHSLILVHNHPSGDPTPSSRDIEMTQILTTAGRVMGIELIDHLIIGKESYTSLYEKGLINPTRKSY